MLQCVAVRCNMVQCGSIRAQIERGRDGERKRRTEQDMAGARDKGRKVQGGEDS